MTNAQYEKANKDLRVRLDNLRAKYEILEVSCREKLEEKDAVIRKQEKDIQMLQGYISRSERDFGELASEKSALCGALKAEREKASALEEKVALLTARINRDSGNSGKPPSADGFKKVIRSSRAKTGRKAGGQKGHRGHTLELPQKLKELIDSGGIDVEVVEHGVRSDRYSVKYELDIKTSVSVREHRFYEGEEAPPQLRNAVNYGLGLKAMCVYLSAVGLVSAERVAALVRDTTDSLIAPSKATVLSFQKEGAAKLAPEMDAIREDILNAPVVCTDETPLKSTQRPVAGTGEMEVSEGTTYSIYARTHSSENSTLITINPRKDIQGVRDDNILPLLANPMMHDHDTKYYNFGNGKHGECNEHVLRYLIGLHDITKHGWTILMKELLLAMLEHKANDQNRGIGEMDAASLEEYSLRYGEIIENARAENAALKEGSAIRKEEWNLLSRLAAYKENHLLFAYDYNVPFTNNMAERDLRWIKTQQKVSGCHRSYAGAVNMARIHSFVSTLRKRGIPLLAALNEVFDGKSVLASQT
jgi:hypothetical protein